METIREIRPDGAGNIKERLTKLEDEVLTGKMKEETAKEQKGWKWPWKWNRQMKKSTKKVAEDKVLVFYLNIKGEMENPLLVPLYSGNIVIHKNKAYEFDPRAMWSVKDKSKIYKALLLKEIDRRPVSNLDWDEVKKRGDATDSDEILVKMVTKAIIEKQKKAMNKGLAILIGLGVLAAIAVFFFMK